MMWHKVRQLLTGAPAVSPGRLPSSASPQLSQRGYLTPLAATTLLETESRQHLLRQLWENSLLPQVQYDEYFLKPLKSCVSLMQQLPATPDGHHAVPGGLIDYSLKVVVFATRLARGYMLPPGASAEEQSAQSAAWGAVVFYCALFRSLSSLRQIEGELLNGETWYPGINVPGQHYRFRFRPTVPDGAGEGLSAMLGMRLLPGEVIHWLSKTPQALDSLLSFIRGDFGNASVIFQIVEDAIAHAGGETHEVLREPCIAVSQSPPAPVMAAVSDTVDNPLMAQVPCDALPGEPVLSPGAEPQDTPGLTSALDENNPQTVPDVPAGQEENDPAIQDVISMMGFGSVLSDEVPVPEVQGQNELPDEVNGSPVNAASPAPLTTVSPVSPPVAEEAGTGSAEVSEDCGQQFISWLRTQVTGGGPGVNTKDAQIHIVGGLMFIPAPGIFFSFMKDNAYMPSQKNDVQREFERLGLHYMQKGKGVFSCLKYESENRTGRYEKVSGYFIKSKIIYQSHPVPDDSLFLCVSKGKCC
ncbi:TraI domain-containing protein [Salmonella enterica]|nr:TraI domain-containing protein [Salmonella enterica]